MVGTGNNGNQDGHGTSQDVNQWLAYDKFHDLYVKDVVSVFSSPGKTVGKSIPVALEDEGAVVDQRLQLKCCHLAAGIFIAGEARKKVREIGALSWVTRVHPGAVAADTVMTDNWWTAS
ncbi:hypothetical protein KCU88_g456, partial [Aureobasidium melanogenum]